MRKPLNETRIPFPRHLTDKALLETGLLKKCIGRLEAKYEKLHSASTSRSGPRLGNLNQSIKDTCVINEILCPADKDDGGHNRNAVSRWLQYAFVGTDERRMKQVNPDSIILLFRFFWYMHVARNARKMKHEDAIDMLNMERRSRGYDSLPLPKERISKKRNRRLSGKQKKAKTTGRHESPVSQDKVEKMLEKRVEKVPEPIVRKPYDPYEVSKRTWKQPPTPIAIPSNSSAYRATRHLESANN